MASARKVSERHLEGHGEPSTPAVQEPAKPSVGITDPGTTLGVEPQDTDNITDPGTTLGVGPAESEVQQKPKKG